MTENELIIESNEDEIIESVEPEAAKEEPTPIIKSASKQKKSAPKEEPKPKSEFVTFRSKEKEPVQFHMRNRYASRTSDGRLQWRFSHEEAELIRRHSFVISGRILEVKDD